MCTAFEIKVTTSKRVRNVVSTPRQRRVSNCYEITLKIDILT